MNNLPARTQSREIQKRHLRRYDSGKVTLVNPKVTPHHLPPQRKPIIPFKAPQLIRPIFPSQEEQKQSFQRIRLYTLSDVISNLTMEPNIHIREFFEEFINIPLEELNKKIKEKTINHIQAEEKFQEIVSKVKDVLEYDEMDPIAWVNYSNGDLGYWGEYFHDNAEGLAPGTEGQDWHHVTESYSPGKNIRILLKLLKKEKIPFAIIHFNQGGYELAVKGDNIKKAEHIWENVRHIKEE